MGYSVHVGGKWNGDLLIADWETIEGAKFPHEIQPTRIRRKEVQPAQLTGGRARFPIATGALKPIYEPQRIAGRDERMFEEQEEEGDNPREVIVEQVFRPPMEAMEQLDYWAMPNEDILIRYHVSPRTA